MPRERERPLHLEAKACYVGQVVYWIMWCDPEQRPDNDNKYDGWYKYRPGLVPEIWSKKIERLTPRTITVEELGKVKWAVYSCPQDAITAKYEQFCLWDIGVTYTNPQPKVSLGMASAYLRLLAELEFSLNNETALDEQIEKPNPDDN
jgi:hypothetical protein